MEPKVHTILFGTPKFAQYLQSLRRMDCHSLSQIHAKFMKEIFRTLVLNSINRAHIVILSLGRMERRVSLASSTTLFSLGILFLALHRLLVFYFCRTLGICLSRPNHLVLDVLLWCRNVGLQTRYLYRTWASSSLLLLQGCDFAGQRILNLSWAARAFVFAVACV